MNFNELAERLGIKRYPKELEKIYETLNTKDCLCPPDCVKELQEKYGLLGEYCELVMKAADEIESREDLKAWGFLAKEYNKTANFYESRLFNVPQSDGTLAGDMLPVLILLLEVPLAVKRYEERGFDSEAIKKNLDNFRINIWVNELIFGRPMLTQTYYSWLRLYIHAFIFDHGAFNFQPAVWGDKAIYLKNRKSGEVYPMMLSGEFHKSGLVLGDTGAADADGSFSADYMEFPDLYVGRLVKSGRVENKISMLSRQEWECILRPGDDVVSLHIPRRANLAPDYVSKSIREGLELAKKHYPELNPKFIVCYSWLLDPQLEKMLGEGTKLASFTKRFNKHPIFDPGLSCLSYVYPGRQNDPIESFPEDTSLQRDIKELMLRGDFIRGTAGVIIETDK